MYNIGIDLGGTNIKVGVVNDDFQIVGKSNIKTDLPRPAEEIADSIAKVRNISVGRGAGVVVSVAGVALIILSIVMLFIKDIKKLDSEIEG